MNAIARCQNVVERAVEVARYAQEETAALRPLYSESDRLAVARALAHLERALAELRPSGPDRPTRCSLPARLS